MSRVMLLKVKNMQKIFDACQSCPILLDTLIDDIAARQPCLQAISDSEVALGLPQGPHARDAKDYLLLLNHLLLEKQGPGMNPGGADAAAAVLCRHLRLQTRAGTLAWNFVSRLDLSTVCSRVCWDLGGWDIGLMKLLIEYLVDGDTQEDAQILKKCETPQRLQQLITASFQWLALFTSF